MITKGWAQVNRSETVHYVALNCVGGCGKYLTLCGKKGWVEGFADESVNRCSQCVHSIELGLDLEAKSSFELAEATNLPPNQIRAVNWPILHLGLVPDGSNYTFDTDGLCLRHRWTLAEITAWPQDTLQADMHCIMKWTMKDLVWSGHLLSNLLKRIQPTSSYVMVHATGDYTTNLHISDLEKGILATHVNGKSLTVEHGGPLRLVIPHLYAWKSVKWVRRIEFIAEDRPGTWEQRGLHNRGDVWAEERFAEKATQTA